MDTTEFKRRMARVRYLSGDYAAGYQRGLRRLHHGESFGTDAEHAQWMSLGQNGDHREELGRGYRDGFSGAEPTPEPGRPELAPDEKTSPRSIRLNAARWAKLQRLGRGWLERAIDKAKVAE